MNRTEYCQTLLDFLKTERIRPTSVHVSHGGSLLLLGLTSESEDIDLTVTRPVWDRFKARGLTEHPIGGGRTLMKVTDRIDIHLPEAPFLARDFEVSPEGIVFRNALRTILDYKALEHLKREKDRNKIRMLERYIKEQNSSLEQLAGRPPSADL